MTILDVPADPPALAPAAAPGSSLPEAPHAAPPRGRRVALTALRWGAVTVSTLVIFSAFLAAKGASPTDALEAMWDTAVGDSNGIGETLIRATPLAFAALATLVAARAGLFNIGAEGQLLLGAVGATGVARMLGDGVPTFPSLVLMGVGGAALGAAWAAIPALLRLVCRMNEAIASLLLNYVARLVVTWLCFERWRDPTSLGQAYSGALTDTQRLPVMWGARVHVGVAVAAVAVVGTWLVLRSTTWGFKLGVVGGNAEAARRAGLAVGGLSFVAFTVGGALAGLGGMIEVAGVEGRLRPEILAGYGYIGFLAAWLARHHPLKAMLAALLLGGIAVGGSGLRISTGLSGGAVNILMALVLFAVLGWGRRPAEAT
jgi:general nucleoside transport system permease protein